MDVFSHVSWARPRYDVYVIPLTNAERRLLVRALRLLVNSELGQPALAESVLDMLERPLSGREVAGLVDVLAA